MQCSQRAAASCIDAALDGRAFYGNILLGKIQWNASRNPYLPFHKVKARQNFRDAMLHLQADIHLHEPEVPLPVQQKFQGARPHISNFLHRIHSQRHDFFPLFRMDGR